MEEWKKVKVSDLGHIVTGKTPKTSDIGNYGGNIPFLTPSDNMSVKYVRSTNKTLTERGLNEVKNCLLPPNAVCVSCIGSDLGKVVMTSEPTVTNQQINTIIVDNDCFDSDFIYYSMGILGKKLNYISKTSTAVPIVNKSSFSSYVILCPTLETQKRIASILNRIDDKIEINRRINDNLQQQAASLYFSMFVSFDYYANMEFEDSEFGRIPKGWQVLSLDDITINIRERVHNNNYRVLSALNSGILQPSDEYFTKQVFSKDISNYIIVAENDFAYNPARVNIGSLGINDLGYTGCVSPVYVVFRTENNYQNFMRFFVKSKRFQEEVKTRASGSVRQAMNYADFSLIRLVYPPKSAIDEFNDMVEPIWKNIKHLRQENERLSELRDSLLPKLMSGEIDVSDVQL